MDVRWLTYLSPASCRVPLDLHVADEEACWLRHLGPVRWRVRLDLYVVHMEFRWLTHLSPLAEESINSWISDLCVDHIDSRWIFTREAGVIQAYI